MKVGDRVARLNKLGVWNKPDGSKVKFGLPHRDSNLYVTASLTGEVISIEKDTVHIIWDDGGKVILPKKEVHKVN